MIECVYIYNGNNLFQHQKIIFQLQDIQYKKADNSAFQSHA